MSQEKQELYQQFANDLAAHLEQVSVGAAEVPVVLEQEPTPGEAFLEEIREHAQAFMYYEHDKDDPSVINQFVWANIPDLDTPGFAQLLSEYVWEFAESTKWWDKFKGAEQSQERSTFLAYAALNYCRKELIKSNEPLQIIAATSVISYIAGANKPADAEFAKNPKKRKHETNEEAVYRTAINDLKVLRQRLSDNQDTRVYWKFAEKLRATDENPIAREIAVIYDADPEFDIIRQGYSKAYLVSTIGLKLALIYDENFTAEGLREAVSDARMIAKRRKEEPEVAETNWTILPPGTLEELEEKGGTTSDGSGESRETQSFVDPERMKWLAGLAMSWSPDAYIAVANLDAAGNYDYRVAVLPQYQDGVLVEHAVAENAASGNAIFSFRAETGTDGSEVWLTWKDVYHETKSDAEALGARRMLHSKHVEDNVLEYLTRPVKELSRRGYKR